MTTGTTGTTTLPAELASELELVAERCGCDILAAKFQAGRLTVVLDREEGGVTLEDCERVSRELSAVLDVLDYGPGKYVLEVSSPGLDREFYRPSDYRRFEGQLVKMTWRDPQTGNKRTDIGSLAAYRNGNASEVDLTIGDKTLTIPLEAVIVTRLEPQF